MDKPQHQDLIEIFDTALQNAAISIAAAQVESLRPVAEKFYATFERARNNLAQHGKLPIVPGNDPHNHVKMDDETAKLSIALSGVYGFTASGNHEGRSPHTIAALRHMQSIAAEIHRRDLTIFT
jgi:hypothetical protein